MKITNKSLEVSSQNLLSPLHKLFSVKGFIRKRKSLDLFLRLLYMSSIYASRLHLHETHVYFANQPTHKKKHKCYAILSLNVFWSSGLVFSLMGGVYFLHTILFVFGEAFYFKKNGCFFSLSLCLSIPLFSPPFFRHVTTVFFLDYLENS